MLLLAIISLFAISCATGGIKVVRTSGDVSLKNMNRQVTGVSRLLADEQDALKDAFAHALSQIASFNGIAIAEEYSQEIIEVTRSAKSARWSQVADSLNITRRAFSKSFVRLFRVTYFVECYRQKDAIQYKAWCHIPFDSQIQQRFLQSLIEEYQRGIAYAENELPANLESNPARYLDGMKEALDFYAAALRQNEGYFVGANDLVIFLKQKIHKLKAETNQFLDNLSCQPQSANVNEVTVGLFYRDKPVQINFALREFGTPALMDTFSVTWSERRARIQIKPLKSGRTTIRIFPAGAEFSGHDIAKFFDLAVDLKMVNRFAGKKVAIAIYDSKNKQFLPETSSLFGKVISSLEGSSSNIQPDADAVMLGAAKVNNCDFLAVGEVDILDNRFNPQQNIHIAFPSFYLKVYEVEADKIIYQNSYPNVKVTPNEMREFGNSAVQAQQNGQSLRSLFQNKSFLNELGSL